MKSFIEQCNNIKIKKENRKSHSWWKRNAKYVLFPLYLLLKAGEKWEDTWKNRHKYSDKRAKKILDKYLASAVYGWMEDNGNFLIVLYDYDSCVYDFQWHFRDYAVKRNKRDRTWVRFYCEKIYDYLRDTYQIDGYRKITGKENWTEVNKLSENNYYSDYSKDYKKYVYFVKE